MNRDPAEPREDDADPEDWDYDDFTMESFHIEPKPRPEKDRPPPKRRRASQQEGGQ